jgi:hypothetical protein
VVLFDLLDPRNAETIRTMMRCAFLLSTLCSPRDHLTVIHTCSVVEIIACVWLSAAPSAGVKMHEQSPRLSAMSLLALCSRTENDGAHLRKLFVRQISLRSASAPRCCASCTSCWMRTQTAPSQPCPSGEWRRCSPVLAAQNNHPLLLQTAREQR